MDSKLSVLIRSYPEKIKIGFQFFQAFFFLFAICVLCFWGLSRKKESESHRDTIERLARAIEKKMVDGDRPMGQPPEWTAVIENFFREGEEWNVAFYRQAKESAELFWEFGTAKAGQLGLEGSSKKWGTSPVWVEHPQGGELFLHPSSRRPQGVPFWIAFSWRKGPRAVHFDSSLTAFVLLLTGLSFSILFAWIFAEKLTPAKDFGNLLSEEISRSRRIFSALQQNWTSYVHQRNQKKMEWGEKISQTLKLKGNFYNDLKEIIGQLERIMKSMEEQSGKVEKMKNSMGEMTVAIKSAASYAEAAVTSSTASENDAKRGGEIVSQIIKHMNKITQTVSRSAMVIRELGERSNEIVDIINVIDDIADQTDLLALNAAIEAARAGPQGRGFAVVADQVRNLAEKTSHATKEIAATLSSIQEKTSRAVAAMDEGIQEIDIGAGFAVQAGVSLRKIVSGAKCVTEMVTTIANASEKQMNAASSSAESISEILKGAESTCENSKTTVTHVHDLEMRTQKLSGLIEDFSKAWMESHLEEEIISLGEWTNKEILLRNRRMEDVYRQTTRRREETEMKNAEK